MNDKLIAAENALGNLLQSKPVTMDEVLQMDFAEAELRAAAWLLISRGEAELDGEYIKSRK